MGLSALSCMYCKTENLDTSNNSPRPLSPLSPGNNHSTSCLYEAHSFQYLIWVEYLSFCNWMISLEKAMAPHSSILAWRIPWMEEPGRLQLMGSPRVGHDWATSLSLFTFMHWRRKMATHSNVLAWRIPGTGEPGRRPSMGSHRVGHDWSDLAAAALLKEIQSLWHFNM